MNTPNIQTDNYHLFKFSGEFNFKNILNLWQQSQMLLAKAISPITVDLSQITQGDSSSIALLISWTRVARKENKIIKFVHPTGQIRALIQLSGLETVLPIQEELKDG